MKTKSLMDKPIFRTITATDLAGSPTGRPLFGAVLTTAQAEKKVDIFAARFANMTIGYY